MISDAQIAAVLLSPPEETAVSIAARLGISASQACKLRRRESRRALRMADRLGLSRRRPPGTAYDQPER